MRLTTAVPVLLAILAEGCAASPVSPAPAPSSPAAAAPLDYRSVHIDTLAPDRVGQFESARIEWLAELRRAGATDGRGVFLQVGPNRFYTLRGFSRFAEFDSRGEAINRSLASMPAGAAERYDRFSDTALVFPHTSEIWRVDTDLGYAPPGAALTERTAACGTLVVEDLRPDPASEKRYEDATAEMLRALAQARYPLTRVTFRTVYGAGHLTSLWLAPSLAARDAAPDADSVVASALGAGRATELAAAREATLVHREALPFVVRHDMTQ